MKRLCFIGIFTMLMIVQVIVATDIHMVKAASTTPKTEIKITQTDRVLKIKWDRIPKATEYSLWVSIDNEKYTRIDAVKGKMCNYSITYNKLAKYVFAVSVYVPDTGWSDYSYSEPVDVRPQKSVDLLEGKTLMVTIFVKDGTEEYDKAEKKQVLKTVREAADFIEDTAKIYGKKSTIVTASDVNSDLVYEISLKGAVKKSLKPNNEKAPHYNNLRKTVGKVNNAKLMKKYKTDSIGYLFFLPGEGRSYICSVGQNYYYEVVTLYKNKSASAIAHEMLHCFGAIDLYYDLSLSEDTSDDVKSVVQRIEEKYQDPYAIMNTTGELNHMVVSDLNLYLLGLKRNKKIVNRYPEIIFPKEIGVGAKWRET